MVSGSNIGSAVLKLSTDASGLDKGFDKVERTSLQRTRDIGKKMTLLVTGPILGIGAAVFKASEEIAEALATIQTGTGATGETLAGLEADFKAVFGSVPADAQTVASAIADLNTTLGLTGEPLREAAIAAIEMADAMGVDASDAIDKTARAMKAFGEEARDPVDVMDRMFVVAQNTNIPIDQLTQTLSRYGQNLAAAGFSMDESIALLGRFHEEGVTARTALSGLSTALDKLANEAQPDFTEAIEDSQNALEDNEQAVERNRDAYASLQERLDDLRASTLEKHGQALERNRDRHEDLSEQIEDLADNALEKHTQATERNAEALQKTEQDLAVHNTRMAEFGENVSESTVLAAEFKRENLQESIAGLRAEQEQLADIGPEVSKQQQRLVSDLEDLDGEFKSLNKSGPKVTVQQKKMEKQVKELDAEIADLNDGTEMQTGLLNDLEKKQEDAANTTVDLKEELTNLFNEIRDGEADHEAITTAADYFGTTAGPLMANAIRSGALELDGLFEAMENSEGAIQRNAEATRTTTEELQMMTNAAIETGGAFGSLPGPIQLAAGGLAGTLAAIGPLLFALPTLIGLVKGFSAASVVSAAKSGIATAADSLRAAATIAATVATGAAAVAVTAFGVALTIATGPIGLIVAAIAGLIAAGVLIYKNWDTIKEKAAEIWGALKAFFTNLFMQIRDIFKEWWPLVLAVIFPPAGLAVLVAKNWGNITEAVSDILDKVFAFFEDLWDKITGWFANNALVKLVTDNWGKVTEVVREIWDKVVGFVKEHWQKIVSILFPAVGLALLIKNNWGRITEVVSDILNKVFGFFGSLWNKITGWFTDNVLTRVFADSWTAVTGAVSGILDDVFGFFGDLWTNITGWFTDNPLTQAFSDSWGNIKETVSGILDEVFAFFGDLWTNVTGWFTDNPLTKLIEDNWGKIGEIVGRIWNAAADAVKGAINKIIGFLNAVIRAWNRVEFRIPGFSKTIGAFGQEVTIGFSGFSIGTPNIPSIPRLETGGIVTEQTLALLGEVPEAVIPLDRLQDVMSGGKSVTVNFYIEGSVHAERDIRDIAKEGVIEAMREGAFADTTLRFG